MPALGDTRKEQCSWKCGKTITVTYARYPASSGVVGFFWDQGEHECGAVRRSKFVHDAAPSGIDLGTSKRKVSDVELRLHPGRYAATR